MARYPHSAGHSGRSPASGGAARPGAATAARNLVAEAATLLTRGDAQGAGQRLRQALLIEPENASALNALGNLAIAAHHYDAAVDLHQRAVKSAPRTPGLLNDLANALILAGDPAGALPHLRKALSKLPRLRPALLNLARAHRDLDQPERAFETLDKLARAQSSDTPTGDIDVDLERAVILTETGRAREAVPLFRAVLAARHGDAKAMDGLATCHRATAHDNDLALMEAALAQPGLTLAARAVAARAAGKILEDLGHDDEAFARYREANEGTGARFDMAAHTAFVEASTRLFTRDHFARRMGWGQTSDLPVFVVGLPRSGTTLVEQILASHPAIAGLGELPGIEATLRAAVPAPPVTATSVEQIGNLPAGAVASAAQRYLAAITQRAGAARRTIDKMPHNFLVLGWIALLFPKARIIHCMRDPLDLCFSCYTHHFSDAHAWSGDLESLGAYHGAYQRLMEHWRRTLPLKILDVRYEEVVADPEREARRMIAHLGLDWDPRCLEFHRSRRVVQTPSRWQVRQPVYRGSIGRWRRFESHLGPLIAALKEHEPSP